MDTLAKEYVVSFYDNTLRLHGDRPEALRWTSQGQMLHYEGLVATDDIIAGSVLDYGCGKGDLYQFLRQKGYHIQYTGMDINPRLITKAKKITPKPDSWSLIQRRPNSQRTSTTSSCAVSLISRLRGLSRQ
ncbi:methyltransferase domain-containing protein [Candidatus Magnetobacterium casense]|uniref:methyltransferase domain-containing protein n=1 Tax=Candidatus Magnetobacterium casense TaxID=1455061 RepID=UPI0009DE4776|nr:class I SAM-dependent methyltransferase [Candidatus Magnetobacterium casensis]